MNHYDTLDIIFRPGSENIIDSSHKQAIDIHHTILSSEPSIELSPVPKRQDEHILPREWKLTKEPDKNDPKYLIDQMVQKYRQKR